MTFGWALRAALLPDEWQIKIQKREESKGVSGSKGGGRGEMSGPEMLKRFARGLLQILVENEPASAAESSVEISPSNLKVMFLIFLFFEIYI